MPWRPDLVCLWPKLLLKARAMVSEERWLPNLSIRTPRARGFACTGSPVTFVREASRQ